MMLTRTIAVPHGGDMVSEVDAAMREVGSAAQLFVACAKLRGHGRIGKFLDLYDWAPPSDGEPL